MALNAAAPWWDTSPLTLMRTSSSTLILSCRRRLKILQSRNRVWVPDSLPLNCSWDCKSLCYLQCLIFSPTGFPCFLHGFSMAFHILPMVFSFSPRHEHPFFPTCHFNKGATPLLLLLRPLRGSALPAPDAVGHAWARTVDRKLRWLWSVPRPDHHIASAEGCGACLGPTAISRAPDAVVIQCAVRLSFVIEALTFRPGDAWRVGIARNPVFSHIKWLPASMWGASFVRRVRLALECSPLSALRGFDLLEIGCAVPK